MYARQLAQHFETNNARSVRAGGESMNLNARDVETRRKPQESLRPQLRDDEYDSDKEHSFLDGMCSKYLSIGIFLLGD